MLFTNVEQQKMGQGDGVGGGVESVCCCFSHMEQGLLLQCKNSYQIRSCCEGLWNECISVYVAFCDVYFYFVTGSVKILCDE